MIFPRLLVQRYLVHRFSRCPMGSDDLYSLDRSTRGDLCLRCSRFSWSLRYPSSYMWYVGSLARSGASHTSVIQCVSSTGAPVYHSE